MGHREIGLEDAISRALDNLADDYNLTLEASDSSAKFMELIKTIANEKGKVVLLIDEYDKPIIDYLGNKIEIAEQNRALLKSFYSVIKDCDQYIEFMMITGISKFSKVSIFSELNNLTDITFHRRYWGLTGISQQELEDNFEEEIKELADENEITTEELKEQIRHWYNGYSWNGIEFDNLEVGAVTFSSYSIKHLQLIPLLFQTGYLTIKERKENDLYILGYPNLEVRNSLLQNIIGFLAESNI